MVIKSWVKWSQANWNKENKEIWHVTYGKSRGNCEEELPKKPVGRLSADSRPTGFAWNIGYLSADSRPTVGNVSVTCR